MDTRRRHLPQPAPFKTGEIPHFPSCAGLSPLVSLIQHLLGAFLAGKTRLDRTAGDFTSERGTAKEHDNRQKGVKRGVHGDAGGPEFSKRC
jgi:hypothetical protein